MASAIVAAVVAYSILHYFYCVRLRGALAARVKLPPRRQAVLLLNWLFRVLAPLALAAGLGLHPSELGYGPPPDWVDALAPTPLLAALNISVSFAFVWVAVSVLREEGP